MEQATVRRAMPEDAAELAVLLDRFAGAGGTPAQVAARMQASAQVLTTYVAEIAGKMAGFMRGAVVGYDQRDYPRHLIHHHQARYVISDS